MTEAAVDVGKLPEWNLDDLYPAIDAPALQDDITAAAKESKAFAARYQGKLATLEGAALGAAIAIFEAIQDRLGRIGSYAQLKRAANLIDPAVARFAQDIEEKLTDISGDLLFFGLEINRLPDDVLDAQLKAPAAAHYASWLRDVRMYRAHQLSDELEKMLLEKRVTGASAWNRLYDETLAALRVPVGSEDLGLEEALHRLSDIDRGKREAAAKALGKVFADNARIFSLVTNTLAKDKEIEDRWRAYPQPWSARHLSNQVEPEVVDALTDAVRAAFPQLSHRYYALKAKWLGLEKLEHWDRNAPLPSADDRIIPWTDARDLVLEAYGQFSPDLAALGRRFFDNAWIDAAMRPGKAGGAFAHPTVPSAHPYLLLNYQGKARDVMTLAHELGHGVHQLLAAPQGALLADTPLTLAETASVFGEQLAFRALLSRESDPARRRMLLAAKVEDMLNTVVRQIAFYEFERRIHAERRQGELTAERIGEIWLAVQTESLGPAFHFTPDYATYWSYIPHFIHSPFYVYAYAFGDCLVNALYAVYQGAEKGFQEKYFAMLRAGGTLRHKELLAPFGLDAGDPAFWSRGLSVIAGFIDELEAAEKTA